MAGSSSSDALPRSAAGVGGPWLMTAVISVATFMEILDTSIANVALDNISGNLGVSTDQGTWLVTSYLVANAIIIPISGFLTRAIGRKRYFLISIALFTMSSLACAFAPNLGLLILARVFQGMGGGGLAPVEQSMIADSFPPEKRGPAFAAFGMVVVVAPIIGPTIGGYITDTISWHWIFLINVPVGIAAFFASAFVVGEPEAVKEDTRKLRARGLKVDWVGFLLTAIGLAGLLIMLDRGQTEDWFSSPLIVAMGILAVAGLGGMVVWELNHEDPIVPLPLLGNRNFAITTLMMLMLGLLVFGTIQLVPQMLQQVFSYNAYSAGLALTYGGAIAIVCMPISGQVVGKVDTRLLLFPAFALQALAFWHFSSFSTNSTFADAAWGRFYISLGLPFMFIPISTVAYVGLKPGEADKASAMLNFFRNLGGAFGISLCQTLLARREQFHQSRLTESLSGLNPLYAENVARLTAAQGGDRQAALATIYSQVQRQAAMLSYDEVFRVLMWCVVGVLPLVLVLRVAGGKSEAPPAH
ncbi:DHA2 family efflux MFS transporter permease subunit [Mangrovibrevibacter kandeliae]|uniref:DHA2 family efflux MFS transporter permease subunit n=1 Tax=Mangrovibrevibacter kandeliae TaxID=2968473 RepID=UPI002118CD23|nr:DHA2 family efflux MFS transporter permease subunit [Aurantimonas sp. CSK15Z-1]MCQ8783801.1 DHA2 family efflux MFS transporter permease subunit [Aurantimonas sp. CSK15Z-1]